MAIPTLYAGHHFRSRLEARWAAFFSNVGWSWTYEPLDDNGYIPDFLIHGDRPFLVEVKPAATHADYRKPIEKLERGLRGVWGGDMLIVGASPFAPMAEESPWHPWLIGVLGEWGDDGRLGWGWDWDDAPWTSCATCSRIGFCHSYQSYTNRPCGHHDGNIEEIRDPKPIQDAWADATNRVRWEGRNA